MTSDNTSVDQLIADYLAAVENGEPPDQDEFIAQHGDSSDALRSFFDDYNRIHRAIDGAFGNTPARQSAPTLIAMPNDATSDSGTGACIDLPDYEVLAEIARGGMGVVYKARQRSLDRIVALKMILSGRLASEYVVDRFLVEARAAAGLDHPGIVPVYEVGTHDGNHFYSMAFINGPSLAALLRDGPFNQTDAVAHVVAIANAVQFAHDRGIIHRDLKPGNILVDADGTPKVTDFGLARRHDETDGLTQTGQIIGTPAYMAPEQATADSADVTTTSDVYSLGAILYCLITGRPPFQASTAVDTLRLVLDFEPTPPRQLNPLVGCDIETICLRCLQKDPARRFASARELAEELKRWQNHQPIQSRPVSRFERLQRWCRRNPTTAALSSLLLLVLVTLAVLTPGYIERRVSLRYQSEQIASQANSSLGRAADFLREAHRVRSGDFSAPTAELVQAESLLSVAPNAELTDQLESLNRDLALVRRLEGARIARSTSLAGTLNVDQAANEYLSALTDWLGESPLDNAERAADSIKQSVATERILAGLDDWSLTLTYLTQQNPDDASLQNQYDAIQQLAESVDDSPTELESFIRSTPPLLAESTTPDPRLQKLAASDDLAIVSPDITIRLGERLPPTERGPLYREALKRAPDDFWLNFEFARISEVDAPEDALSHYIVAQSLRPESAFAAGSLGMFYFRARDLERARDAFERAVTLDPKNLRARHRLFRTLGLLEHHAAAAELADRTLNEYPDSAIAMTMVAQAFNYKASVDDTLDRNKGEEMLREAIRADPQLDLSHYALGGLLYIQKRYEAAKAPLEKAIELNPTLAGAELMLARNLARLSKNDAAIRHAEAALAVNPRDGEAWQFIGTCHDTAGEFRKAIQAYLMAAELIDKPDGYLHYNLGNALRETGDQVQATRHFRHALELELPAPHRADAHVNLAVVLKRQNNYTEAIQHYKKAIEIRPDIPDAWYNLGICYRAWGMFEESVDAFDKAIAQLPDDYQAMSNEGDAWMKMGYYKRGLTDLERALEKKPDYALGLFRKGQVLLYLGRFDESQKILRRSHELGQNSHSWSMPALQFAEQAEALALLADKKDSIRNVEFDGLNVDDMANRVLFAWRHGMVDAAFAYAEKLEAAGPSVVAVHFRVVRSVRCGVQLAGTSLDSRD
ncbi:protein kinase domain-containing protein [Fuerstiella marisgermanici]|uniref:non-specific serine/threonine protein kinase n=1 Tax=Fuerstiella marisgermanici TaxID=1891926 RepID=A0A1P8WB83_9PLAN|nr:serine/threonine-protein kinase [Fuerstiella marisgermanici]APZ91330.1 Serine/threonine-protein kinase PrkC [Fuerstiella marisgermanici]